MAADLLLDDLHLTAFMSSKICHDLVGPVGAINNGLELLDEETDEQTRAYAFELIQFSANAARARLEYARLAFGASTAVGSEIDLRHAEGIVRAFVEEGKHRLNWQVPAGTMEKNKARLLLMLLAVSMPAIPAGGNIVARMDGTLETPFFELRCTGRGARIPEGLADMLAGSASAVVDPRSVISYYTARLADSCGMTLTVRKDGTDIVFEAIPLP
jgi:histidine phosphotransferase ChpT